MSYCQRCADLERSLATETAAIRAVRDEMGSKFQQAADALFTVTVAPHVFNEWLAALDAIIQKRTNA